MAELRIAFYKGRKKLFNRLVSWWTQGLYSHCELIESFEDNGDANCWSSSFTDGGVRLKTIALKEENWDIETISVPQFVIDDAVAWFKEHNGDAYDVAGLFGFVWAAAKHSSDKWFCSEAVAAALGLKEAWRISPNALRAFVDVLDLQKESKNV